MSDERETSKFALTSELAALEQHLAKVELLPPRLDRDLLMFAAGRAAERTTIQREVAGRLPEAASVASVRDWIWPAATAVTTAASIILGMMLFRNVQTNSLALKSYEPHASGEPVVVRAGEDFREVARLEHPRNTSLHAPSFTSGYLNMRHIALTRGASASSLDFRSSAGDSISDGHSLWNEPSTARELLDELLPVRTRAGNTGA